MFRQSAFNRATLLALRVVVSFYGLLCVLFFLLISYDRLVRHHAGGYPRGALPMALIMLALALLIRRAATWALQHRAF